MPFSDGNNVASALLTTVPAGKQFVVTYASASAHLSVATHASFRILKSSSLGTVAVYELKPVSTETIAGIVASEPLHIFVNAGESFGNSWPVRQPASSINRFSGSTIR